ncbi:hypothetical protein [Natronoflexus pectinivorans]|uniref:Uncharacterized protein n=1 Tax=Natronoflexus pectinivorans TaxID=682526 RepID=A0A4R2GIK9_9BACT|nr:hypothetical protein [Natronoflexus pectinivorans]TCO08419.1 hypothetical protein EV194_105226 [Natronoflexus pectinivorans]TCO08467.1 hypothetical protein EV194_105276 [Natronoflexus pectinivorans]
MGTIFGTNIAYFSKRGSVKNFKKSFYIIPTVLLLVTIGRIYLELHPVWIFTPLVMLIISVVYVILVVTNKIK